MATRQPLIERFAHHDTTLVAEITGEPGLPPLVLLHGWGATRESLRGIGVLFAHTHRVHLIDLPGFGEAPPPATPCGTVEYADLVQQYLIDRVDSPALLVGHSFGGRIAVRLAARHLPQVAGLVLMGVPGLPWPSMSRRAWRRRWIQWLRRGAHAMRPLVGTRLLEWHTARYGSADYRAAGPLRDILVRVVSENLTESAQQIACPTLLLWGADDTETPRWMGERYASLLGAKATLEVLAHKGHHMYAGTGAHLCGARMRRWREVTSGV